MTSSIMDGKVRRRIVGSLFVTQSLFSAAVITAFTLTPIIAAELSGSDSLAGLPATVTLIARAVAAYPVGWLLDRIGRRLGLSLGYAVGLTGAVISIWSIINGSFAGFLTGAALFGGTRASAEQSRYVAAEVYEAPRQSKVIGWIVFAGTFGAIVGPLLVGFSEPLAERLGINPLTGPFLISGMLMLLAGIIIYAFLRPDPARISKQIEALEQKNRVGKSADPVEARSVREIFSSAPALFSVAAMAIGQLVMAMLMVITPLHMNHHDHGTQSISLVIMAHTLGMFGLSGVTGWLIERIGRLPIIAAGSIILIVACLLAPVSTAMPLLALSLFLLGLGWNFCFVAGSSLLSNQLAASERGRAQGAGEVAVASAAGAGSLVSGIIFARGDIIAVSVVGLAFSILLLGMVAWMLIARRPSQVLAPGD